MIRTTTTRLRHRLLMALATGCAAVAISGCESREPIVTYRHEQAQLSSEDNFQKAFEMLKQMDEFEPEQLISQIAYNLNRWLAAQPKAKQWIRDPMASDPALGALLRLPSLANLDRLDVQSNDVRFLQETQWLSDVSQWAVDRPASFELEQWLTELPNTMEPSAAKKLDAAARLFDWSVRNVQLEPLAEQEPLPPKAKGDTPPAALARRGPGYTMLPWQTLLLGRGDAWQRARIAILLMRQAGIDACVLATPRGEQQESPQLHPWAVAALVDEQLYLFDPALGMAIPGPGQKGIATLAQVLAEPSLLQQLNAGEDEPYPVQEGDLAEVVAWLDASTESMSQRMRIIEERLTGEQRLRLTTSPTAIKRQLADMPGIQSVSLWKIPLEAELFAAASYERRKRDSRQNALWMREMAMFSGLTPLMQARQLYFRHQFESDDERSGAAAKYLEARVPEASIANMTTDTQMQKDLGLTRQLGESDVTWRNRIALSQSLFLEGTIHASYWLGLLHYENGDYESAVNWLLHRNLNSTTQTVWQAGARYNLARSYEALGKYAEARDQLLQDDSPQRHGNRVRARWLKARVPGS